MLLADPVSDDIHGAMQGGRNNDDGDEPQECVAGEESRDRPARNRETEEKAPDDEVVLVQPRRLRAARLVHPSLDERSGQIAEQRPQSENRGGHESENEGFDSVDGGVAERPRRTGCEEGEWQGDKETKDGPHRSTSKEAPPRLPVPEDPLAVAQAPAEVDRSPPAKDDGHGIREESREEEPECLGNRL